LLKLLIFGSCASRDAVEYATPESIELVDYFARSSFSSLTSKADLDEDALSKIKSDFQRSMVHRDMSKIFWKVLKQTEFDLFLVDLIDERFAITQNSNGALHTLSNEYATVRNTQTGGVIYPATSIEKFVLWQKGWNKTVSILREQNALHKLVVNRVYWAGKDSQGNDLSNTKESLIKVANIQLDRMYDYITEQDSDIKFLSYPRGMLTADVEHKWGVAPFHYQRQTYLHTLKQLLCIKGRQQKRPAETTGLPKS